MLRGALALSLGIALSAGASGCAGIGGFKRSPKAPQEGRRAPSLAASEPLSRAERVLAYQSEDDPLLALERELSYRNSERVTVPTSLLRALLKHQKESRERCEALSEQLDAIKHIDVEEGRGAVPAPPPQAQSQEGQASP